MHPAPAQLTDLAHLRLAVVDVETSGLDPRRHRVLQVAVVVIDGHGTVLTRWSSLVRPRWKWAFRLGPRHVHGLHRAMLRNAPREAEVMATLSGLVGDATFTAHNAAFDADFLLRSAQRAGVTLQLSPRLCTLRLSRDLDPDRQQSHRLTDVCARYEITNGKPHDALEDALATAAVVPHLLRAHGISSADQLTSFTSSA